MPPSCAQAYAEALAEGREHVGTDDLVADFLTTPSDRPLIDLVHLVGRHVVPLAVVDEQARMLGVVPRATVLDALTAAPTRTRS